MSDSQDNVKAVVGLILIAFFALAVPSCYAMRGRGGYGPERVTTATVKSKHVDARDKGSSYMLTTDKGTFEVDNGILLGLWNADELYGNIEVGKTYEFTTSGRESANMFWQQYPYITKAVEVKK